MKDELLILVETAMLARDIGFEERCTDVFIEGTPLTNFEVDGLAPNNTEIDKALDGWQRAYTRPTQSLLQKYLRLVYGVHVYPKCNDTVNPEGNYSSEVLFENERISYHYGHDSYEWALEYGLNRAMKKIIELKIKRKH